MAEQTRTKARIQRPSTVTPDPPTADVETVDPDVDGLVARISEILAGFDDLHARAVDAYRPMVADILRTGCQDRQHIERTLDGLLGFCGHEAALALFKRLCRYYWDIDPMATADYVYAYRDMFGSDERSEVASSEH